MEFGFSLPAVLCGSQLCRIDGGTPHLLAEPLEKPVDLFPVNQLSAVERQAKLVQIIDAMGRASTEAQQLPHVITTAKKLQLSDHRLYLLADFEDNCVIGIIKVGVKTLFLYDSKGINHEVDPLCVLDFFVCPSHQRHGYGKQLFDAMLSSESQTAQHLAVDRPSNKLLRFMHKHFNLTAGAKQTNNFVVFDKFFQNRPSRRSTGRRLDTLRDRSLPANPQRRYPAAWIQNQSFGGRNEQLPPKAPPQIGSIGLQKPASLNTLERVGSQRPHVMENGEQLEDTTAAQVAYPAARTTSIPPAPVPRLDLVQSTGNRQSESRESYSAPVQPMKTSSVTPVEAVPKAVAQQHIHSTVPSSAMPLRAANPVVPPLKLPSHYHNTREQQLRRFLENCNYKQRKLSVDSEIGLQQAKSIEKLNDQQNGDRLQSLPDLRPRNAQHQLRSTNTANSTGASRFPQITPNQHLQGFTKTPGATELNDALVEVNDKSRGRRHYQRNFQPTRLW